MSERTSADSSADEQQRFGSHGGVPGAISLPESPTASSIASDDLQQELAIGHSGGYGASQSSLEVISQFTAPVIPSIIPPPAPRPSSEGQSAEGTPSEQSTGQASARQSSGNKRGLEALLTYENVLDNAAKVLDHIKDGNVRLQSRHEKTSITYYDYAENSMSEPLYIDDHTHIPWLGYPSPDVHQRLIIVEDLSKPTIHGLGLAFSINPEFFEEHLVNSNYARLSHSEPPARTWKTASLAKSYVTFRWIRPVYRLHTYFSQRDLEDLVQLDGYTEHITRQGTVKTQVTTNIFRSDWSLWTDPSMTIGKRRECGLEEKVSIWKGRIQNSDCDIVIVLLDPLPEVSETHRRWGLDHHGENDSDAQDDSSQRSVLETDLVEEELGGDFGQGPPRFDHERSFLPLAALFMKRGSRKHIPSHESIDDDAVAESEPPSRSIIEQMAPRQAVRVDLDRVFRAQPATTDFGKRLSQTWSTQAEICDALNRDPGPVSLAMPLLELVRRDTLTLIQHLRRVVDEVEIEILDDAKMEDRLILWRQLISRAQRELPELKASMEPFWDFLQTTLPQSIPERHANDLMEVVESLKRLPHDIDQMSGRLQVVSAALASNMSLLESRRSIDEAHAVARLTELAFVFVPLSFATSVFGMQIEPFANPVPSWNFFLVAVLVTGFSYLMRMTMRSQWLVLLKAVVKYDVRKYAERHGQPVEPRSLPTGIMIQWLASRLGLGIIKASKWTTTRCVGTGKRLWAEFGFVLSFILLVGTVSAAPLAVLYSRDLDPATQSAVSIAILIIVVGLVGVPLWYMSESRFRNALPNRLKGLAASLPDWGRVILTLLAIMGALIGIPLVLIWTRSLAFDIKSGLSVAVVLAMLFGMGFAGINRVLGRVRYSN
ncbi:hypothetical protein BO78DRAFT_439499, partial [Aspergillus sclerotiicarbonarius CBS 121057]